MQGFVEMERDYSDSRYERAEGYYESGTSWDIYSIFSDKHQQVFHHLLVYEYRLFKNPVDILGAQYIENILVKKNDECYLEILKATYSMAVKIMGFKDSEKSRIKSLILEGPQEYDADKIINYVKSFLDFRE
jgi:hypothetical protein